MGFKFSIGGVGTGTDRTDRVRQNDIPGFTESAFGGETDFSGIPLDDTQANLSGAGAGELQGFKGAFAEESECPTDFKRIWTGYVEERTTNRGRISHVTGDDRKHDAQLISLNAVLSFRLLKGNDAIRPDETDVQRVAWLLTRDEYAGIINDFGFVSTDGPRQVDAADYRGRTAKDVLADCVAPAFGKNFFCYWDEAEEGIGLFYDDINAVTYTSDLTLSNVREDWSDTCLDPLIEATLVRNPDNVYDGVLVKYGPDLASMIYRTRPETHTTFNIHRDGLYENNKIGRLSTAESFAAQFLQRHSVEEDTITVSVIIPAAQVNLARAGMRMEVRFQHLPDYEEFVFMRIAERTVSSPRIDDGAYLVTFTLVNHGPTGGGGGGGTPTEPWVPCPPTPPTLSTFGVRRYVSVEGTLTPHTFSWDDAIDLDANPVTGPPIPGSTCVTVAIFRDPGNVDLRFPEAELTTIVSLKTQGDSGASGSDVGIGTRTFHGNDTTTQRWNAGTSSLVNWSHPLAAQGSIMVELTKAATVDSTDSDGAAQHGARLSAGTLTVPDDGLMFGGARVGSADFSGVTTLTEDAGVTSLLTYGPGPDAWIAYRTTTGEIGANASFGDFLRDWHGGVSAVFIDADPDPPAEDEDCPPPLLGQPVAPLEVDVDDCDTLDYQTPFPYQAHTLKVSVRRGGQLFPVLFVETDPSTGAFQLLESPCESVPRETQNMTIFDEAADEWKIMFLDDGTPMTMEMPEGDGGLPTLVVEFIAGAGDPTGPPIIVEPPPATLPDAVTDWYSGSPGTGSDQSAALKSFIEGTAGIGKVLGIHPGIYRVDSCFIDTIDHVTLVGTGVTLVRTSNTASDAILTFWSCDDLAVYDLTVQGPATLAGIEATTTFARENEHAFMLVDNHGATLSNVTGTNVWGDGLYYSRIGAGAASTLVEDLLVDSSTFVLCGRNGISHISGRRILVRNSTMTQCGLHGFDVEGNFSDDVTEDLSLIGLNISQCSLSPTGVDGLVIQVGPGYDNVLANRVLIDTCHFDVATLHVLGVSSGSRATDVTVQNSIVDTAGTGSVVHVNGWVNINNDGLTLPASGDIA